MIFLSSGYDPYSHSMCLLHGTVTDADSFSQTEFGISSYAGFGSAGNLAGFSIYLMTDNGGSDPIIYSLRKIVSSVPDAGSCLVTIDNGPDFTLEPGHFYAILPAGLGAADADKIDQLLVRLSLARAALIDKLDISGNVASENDLGLVVAKLPSRPFLAASTESDGSLDFEGFDSLSETIEDALTVALDNSEIVFHVDTLDAFRDHLLGGKLHLDSVIDIASVEPSEASFAGGPELSEIDGFYSDANCNVVFTSGVLQSLCNSVVGYEGDTKKLFFEPPWPVAPSEGDTFVFVGRID
jgi:hypothetical protein